VVAERDRVDAGREHLVSKLRRDPDTVREILAVQDAKIDPQLVAQRGQALFQRTAPRDADRVGDEEDSHG